MEITHAYFREEWQRYWAMLGDRNTTVDEIFRGWRTLLWLAWRCTGDQATVERELDIAHENIMRRLPHFERLLIKKPDCWQVEKEEKK